MFSIGLQEVFSFRVSLKSLKLPVYKSNIINNGKKIFHNLNIEEFFQVPSYSPGSIAEYAIAQIMALAKNTHMSYVMTKKANFEVTSMQVVVEMGMNICYDGHTLSRGKPKEPPPFSPASGILFNPKTVKS